MFRAFSAVVVPHEPRSEFAFLIMLAALRASITRGLGEHYLAAAFIVGMAADHLRDRLPGVFSEQMLNAASASIEPGTRRSGPGVPDARHGFEIGP